MNFENYRRPQQSDAAMASAVDRRRGTKTSEYTASISPTHAEKAMNAGKTSEAAEIERKRNELRALVNSPEYKKMRAKDNNAGRQTPIVI